MTDHALKAVIIIVEECVFELLREYTMKTQRYIPRTKEQLTTASKHKLVKVRLSKN